MLHRNNCACLAKPDEANDIDKMLLLISDLIGVLDCPKLKLSSAQLATKHPGSQCEKTQKRIQTVSYVLSKMSANTTTSTILSRHKFEGMNAISYRQ